MKNNRVNSDRDNHIWVFNSGNFFSGNPKWLFLYLIENRPDISVNWLCYTKETLKYVKNLGYHAFLYNSSKGKLVMKKAGVYVVEQAKEIFQPELEGIKILNLWHGVGCKAIEKNVVEGFLAERVIKKNIKNFQTYKNYQMFLVTSPLMEEHFKKQCDIDDDKVIRAGYPNTNHNFTVSTYNHNILQEKGLPSDTKIAIYSPTYRDGGQNTFFGTAIPDMERLIKQLKNNNMLLIFKMHPQMENDFQYKALLEKYKDCPQLLFWNNLNDIYEILNKIDLAIIDYSSIFYDMLKAGVKHFIRYMFDIDNKSNLRDFVFDVKEMTCGKECNNFEELLDALDNYEEYEDIEEKERIYNLFWSYSDSNEQIVQSILQFSPETDREFPTLYSFDIFDTLIKRKCLHPHGVFHYVKDKLVNSQFQYTPSFIKNYVNIRRLCESNVREYYKKSTHLRNDDRIEIHFEEIFEKMQNIHSLSNEQVAELMQLEIEGELENCIPYEENLSILKSLLKNDETVVLISDMYLPKNIISQMITKADPVLGTLPLFLSSEIGVQKTTRKLFIHVYKSIDYHFKDWVHYGDNLNADIKQPKKLGIKALHHNTAKINEYENEIINEISSYDSYLAVANMARFTFTHQRLTEFVNGNIVEVSSIPTNQTAKSITDKPIEISSSDIYAYKYVSLYFVPYVSWIIKDAIKKGFECLYFISRDGYHLKRIADKIIEIKGLSLKTKYIYGSRKAWRIPSFVDDVDQDFFSTYGNFASAQNFQKLLRGLAMNEKEFSEIFPVLSYLKGKSIITKKEMLNLRNIFSESKAYREFLLHKAKKQRKIIVEYLQQEIDFQEKFAFVEYWGRGYTQDCFTRLLEVAAGKPVENPFYYLRSIYPTHGNSIRYNYQNNNTPLIFVESIFANLNYKSIENYKYNEQTNKIEPILKSCDNDKNLHQSLETYLLKFCEDFYSCNFLNEDSIEWQLSEFALNYFKTNQLDKFLLENLAPLKDSVELYSKPREFAPPLSLSMIGDKVFRKIPFKAQTRSKQMSLARSGKTYKRLYSLYNSVLRKPIKKVRKVYRKIRKK